MDGGSEEGGRPRGGFDARLTLVLYVRLLALIFILSGLSRWATVLGLTGPEDGFMSLPGQLVVATIFFAVTDLVAAVGLWLLAPWGTVVWLIDALTETTLNTLFSDIYGMDPGLVAFHVASVVIYALLTFLYERSRT